MEQAAIKIYQNSSLHCRNSLFAVRLIVSLYMPPRSSRSHKHAARIESFVSLSYSSQLQRESRKGCTFFFLNF